MKKYSIKTWYARELVILFKVYWHKLKTLNYITKLIMFSHNCVVTWKFWNVCKNNFLFFFLIDKISILSFLGQIFWQKNVALLWFYPNTDLHTFQEDFLFLEPSEIHAKTFSSKLEQKNFDDFFTYVSDDSKKKYFFVEKK